MFHNVSYLETINHTTVKILSDIALNTAWTVKRKQFKLTLAAM